MDELKIPDYGEYLNRFLESSESVLKDFEFTDSLTFDARNEVDASPVYTAGLFRTSGGEDRAQLAAVNELGAEAGGLYIYVNNIISTAFTQGSIFFYDTSGALSAVIQQPTAGNLAIAADTIYLNAENGDITIDVDDAVIPGSDDAYDIGSPSATWDVGYFNTLVANSSFVGNYLTIIDGVTAPGTTSGFAHIYVDSADGDLKVKFGDGFVAVLAADS